ncbi:MAG TPA: alpha/beta hydrolase [bacterium]|nr:alpha/beta hydrolase [bacterium]
MGMTSRFLTCKGLELHVLEWGAGNAETVVMWHGLVRTGRDFDALAEQLSRRFRVLCPDTPGRGLSQWAQDPDRQYTLPFYGECAVSMLEQLGIAKLRWVGTSMGGQLGMLLAAGALKGRVSHLLLNDIGPEVPLDAGTRIVTYVSQPPVFATVRELEQRLRTVYAPFNIKDDNAWRQMAVTSLRRTDSGQITLHYDPKLVAQFTSPHAKVDLWQAYDGIACKTHLLRGALSDVLPEALAQRMTQRGPRCTLTVYPATGHAPALQSPEQIAEVERFLLS